MLAEVQSPLVLYSCSVCGGSPGEQGLCDGECWDCFMHSQTNKSIQLVYMRIRSCLGVSHKPLRERIKLLEIAFVCIKEPLRQKIRISPL